MSITSEDANDKVEMDQTLDPINTVPTEMSYICSRDPSILACSQQPYRLGKKNLFSLYEVEETIQEDSSSRTSGLLSSQKVKVYLRMKPPSLKAKLTDSQREAYRIADVNTLITKLPSLDCTTVSVNKSTVAEVLARKWTFTETFGAETTQRVLFEKVIGPRMVDFMSGHNFTLMTYGTTNSGKSYTLQGTPSAPGIIPRALEYVFSRIKPTMIPVYKPQRYADVAMLSARERLQEQDCKTNFLASGIPDRNKYVNAYRQMESHLKEEFSCTSTTGDAKYSVWVSFAEIYNENIFDLLSDGCQKNRSSLKIGTDSEGRAFVKGLKSIFVNSGSEAFQVLMAGQYNLKVAATALNARSSRSHCIFTIKLVKYYREDDPMAAEVSTFAFGDLAGSERLKKTLNVGDRLKEAQNINSSLLVFGRCLKSIYEGQMQKSRTGPFRESKLTQLFKQALSGEEPLALIVNVNPSPNLYAETANVLKFAAIAKKIVVQPKKKRQVKRRSTRFSQIVSNNAKTRIDWEDTAELDNIPESSVDPEEIQVSDDDYDDLLEENEQLKKEIHDLRAKMLKRDMETRNELTNQYKTMMNQMKERYENRLKNSEAEQEDLVQWKLDKMEEYYNQKLSQVSKKRRYSDSSDLDDDDDTTKIKELELENQTLEDQIYSLKNQLKDARKDKDNAETKQRKTEYELSIVIKDLERTQKLLESLQADIDENGETKKYHQDLMKQLIKVTDTKNSLTELLNDAREEYQQIQKELLEKENIIVKLEKENAELTEENQDLEENCVSINECMSEQQKKIDNLEDNLEKKGHELFKTRERILELEAIIADHKKNSILEIADESMVIIKQKHVEEISSLQKQLESMEEENATLQEKLLNAYEDNHVIIKNLEETDEKNEKLEEKLQITVEQMDELKKNLDEMKEKNIEINKKLEIVTSSTEKSVECPSGEGSQTNFIIKTENVEYCDGGSQTAIITSTDQMHQTSFIDPSNAINEKLTDTEKQLEQMTGAFEKLQTQYITEKIQFTELEKAAQDTMKSKVAKITDCHVQETSKLKEQIETMEREDIATKEQLKEREINIVSLEQRLIELENDISQLKIKLELSKNLESDLKKKVDDNNQEIAALNEQLAALTRILHEKDEEISRLQNELKAMLQSNVKSTTYDDAADRQMKDTLTRLRETEDKLLHSQNINKDINRKISEQEMTIKILKQEIEETKNQIENLTTTIKILNSTIDQKDLEMESFTKNRATMIENWERLLKIKEEELAKLKQEQQNHYQSVIPVTPRDKENNDGVFQMPSTDRSLKPMNPPASPSDGSVVELSGSESKRPTRRAALKSKQSQSERKPRKKKLFTNDVEALGDFPPVEMPVQPTRSLRTRKNK